MTSTETESTVAARAQTFIDWTRINSTALTIASVVVLVAGAGFWFYQRNQQSQAIAAERALVMATEAMKAGNLQLAQNDLQKLYTHYKKTGAGVQAAVQLTQIDYNTGKFQEGVTRLQQVAGSSAASNDVASIMSLEGDGYAQMGKNAEAAKAYQAAADASPFQNEKALQLSKAARAYRVAGDTAKARDIWTRLLNDPDAQSMAAEARVRLGELEAETAKR